MSNPFPDWRNSVLHGRPMNRADVNSMPKATMGPVLAPTFEEQAAVAEARRRVLCPPPEPVEVKPAPALEPTLLDIAAERKRTEKELAELEAKLNELRAKQ